ncbi:MAG: hypothetical protein KF713_15800 [Turneriella sp.]|nr:hypothetical protein [Turneriella sp.]
MIQAAAIYIPWLARNQTARHAALAWFSSFIILCAVGACGSTSYRYIPDKELTYTMRVNGKNLETKLNPTYHDLTNPGIISSYLNFSETQANWAKLEKIEITLYDGEKIVPLKKNKLRISYWDGKSSPDIKREDFPGALYDLYPDDLVHYKYNDTMMATFSYDMEYETEVFPETLRQKLVIRFKDKILNFENTLRKKKSEKALISGRPFG